MSVDPLAYVKITDAANPAGVYTIDVKGELDVFNVGAFEEALERASGSELVVVDFRQCRYIDSSSISILIRARKKTGDKIRIVAKGGSVRRVLSLTHLEDVIPVVSSPEELS